MKNDNIVEVDVMNLATNPAVPPSALVAGGQPTPPAQGVELSAVSIGAASLEAGSAEVAASSRGIRKPRVPRMRSGSARRGGMPWSKPVALNLSDASLRELLWNMDESPLATDAARRIDALLEAAEGAAPTLPAGVGEAMVEAA